MEHFKEPGIYGSGDVWRFYTIEEAEAHETKCSNWPHMIEEFKQFLGKIWEDTKDIRYSVNSKPVYKEYKVIGVEDNSVWADYYWILKDNKGTLKFELANNADFKNHIKD